MTSLAVYLMLSAAVVCEVVGTSLLRSTEGFTRLLPTLGCLVSYGVAFLLLSRVVAHLSVGVTYALWSGLGTFLIVAVGVTVLGDPLTWQVALGIGLIVAGVVVLNLSGAHA